MSLYVKNLSLSTEMSELQRNLDLLEHNKKGMTEEMENEEKTKNQEIMEKIKKFEDLV